MSVLKHILAIVCSVPFWVLAMWLCATIMERLSDLSAPDDSSVIAQILINPLLGIIVAFIVPFVFIALGIGVWFAFSSLFGI